MINLGNLLGQLHMGGGQALSDELVKHSSFLKDREDRIVVVVVFTLLTFLALLVQFHVIGGTALLFCGYGGDVILLSVLAIDYCKNKIKTTKEQASPEKATKGQQPPEIVTTKDYDLKGEVTRVREYNEFKNNDELDKKIMIFYERMFEILNISSTLKISLDAFIEGLVTVNLEKEPSIAAFFEPQMLKYFISGASRRGARFKNHCSVNTEIIDKLVDKLLQPGGLQVALMRKKMHSTLKQILEESNC